MADEDLKEKINNLTNSDLLQNDRLEELEERLDGLEHLFEGNPADKDDNGIKGDLNDFARRMNKLEALMAPDSIGEGGVIRRLQRLEKQAGFEDNRSERRLKFWLAVLGAAVAIATAVIPNLERIEKFFEPRSSIEPAPKKRRVVKRVIRMVPDPGIPESD